MTCTDDVKVSKPLSSSGRRKSGKDRDRDGGDRRSKQVSVYTRAVVYDMLFSLFLVLSFSRSLSLSLSTYIYRMYFNFNFLFVPRCLSFCV
jgi:hypothetical protein